MVGWNAIFEVEQIEKLTLIALLPPHHDPLRRQTNQATGNHATDVITSPFSTVSTHSGRRALRFAVAHTHPVRWSVNERCWPVADESHISVEGRDTEFEQDRR